MGGKVFCNNLFTNKLDLKRVVWRAFHKLCCVPRATVVTPWLLAKHLEVHSKEIFKIKKLYLCSQSEKSSGNWLSYTQRMNRWGCCSKRRFLRSLSGGDNTLTHLYFVDTEVFAKTCQTFDGIVGMRALVHAWPTIQRNSSPMFDFPIKKQASHVFMLQFPLSFFFFSITENTIHTQNKKCVRIKKLFLT